MKFLTFLFLLMSSTLVACRPSQLKSDMDSGLVATDPNDIMKPADDASIANGGNSKPSDSPQFPPPKGKKIIGLLKRVETDSDEDWNLVEELKQGQRKGEVKGYWKELKQTWPAKVTGKKTARIEFRGFLDPFNPNKSTRRPLIAHEIEDAIKEAFGDDSTVAYKEIGSRWTVSAEVLFDAHFKGKLQSLEGQLKQDQIMDEPITELT